MAQNPNLANLDPGQVINRVFNSANDAIRVDANIVANIAATEVIISHTDDSIRIGDGTSLVTTTTMGSDVGLDTYIIGGAISGAFTPSGLRVQGRNTTLDVTDTAVALPVTPLTARNALSLVNLSENDILYIGFSSSVTANRTNGTNAGWEIGPFEGFNLDIQDNILIYGIAETGKTVKVKVMELA